MSRAGTQRLGDRPGRLATAVILVAAGLVFAIPLVSMVEFTVPHDSPLIGRTLGGVDWPLDSTVVAILRDDTPITPSQDDVIEGGDELFFVTTIAAEAELRTVLRPHHQA